MEIAPFFRMRYNGDENAKQGESGYGNCVDFINVMAYDGGDGERHSSYQFAVDCGNYWKEIRGLPAHKVVLDVPFYARPGWADYGTILSSVPDAYGTDHVFCQKSAAGHRRSVNIYRDLRYLVLYLCLFLSASYLL